MDRLIEWAENQSFQKMVLEQLDIHTHTHTHTHTESRHIPYIFQKSYSKMEYRFQCKMQNSKFLEDNIRENLDDLGYGDDFNI